MKTFICVLVTTMAISAASFLIAANGGGVYSEHGGNGGHGSQGGTFGEGHIVGYSTHGDHVWDGSLSAQGYTIGKGEVEVIKVFNGMHAGYSGRYRHGSGPNGRPIASGKAKILKILGERTNRGSHGGYTPNDGYNYHNANGFGISSGGNLKVIKVIHEQNGTAGASSGIVGGEVKIIKVMEYDGARTHGGDAFGRQLHGDASNGKETIGTVKLIHEQAVASGTNWASFGGGGISGSDVKIIKVIYEPAASSYHSASGNGGRYGGLHPAVGVRPLANYYLPPVA